MSISLMRCFLLLHKEILLWRDRKNFQTAYSKSNEYFLMRLSLMDISVKILFHINSNVWLWRLSRQILVSEWLGFFIAHSQLICLWPNYLTMVTKFWFPICTHFLICIKHKPSNKGIHNNHYILLCTLH
jgi:hypothetical protein